MGTKFDWAGTVIMPYPIAEGKRALCPPTDALILMDMRDFIIPLNRQQLIKAFTNLEISEPALAKAIGAFDARVHWCWQFLITGGLHAQTPGTTGLEESAATTGPQDDGAEKAAAAPQPAERLIRYVAEPTLRNEDTPDFWQLPSETIARKAGDCEDLAILLASLMIGVGVSPYCVRVVVGDYHTSENGISTPDSPHAWVAYKTESGPWCLIDPTWDSTMFLQGGWYLADGCDDGIVDKVTPNVRHHYTPSYAFNCDHAWDIHTIGDHSPLGN